MSGVAGISKSTRSLVARDENRCEKAREVVGAGPIVSSYLVRTAPELTAPCCFFQSILKGSRAAGDGRRILLTDSFFLGCQALWHA